MKGIIRGGGQGTRLHPCTKAVNKVLFPVYDKPAVYYPISLLIMAGVTDILIDVSAEHQEAYYRLLGDGSRFGINISYFIEERTMTPPEMFLQCRSFIGTDSVVVALGDNIFVGEDIRQTLEDAAENFEKTKGATVFCKEVDDPWNYGVVEYKGDGSICSLESKPRIPKSNNAVTGLFFFDDTLFEVIGRTKPAEDGSIVLADLLVEYLRDGRLNSVLLNEGIQWFDAGTPERLYLASGAVRAFQQSHETLAGSIEEAAFEKGLIDRNRLSELAADMSAAPLGQYLAELAQKPVRCE